MIIFATNLSYFEQLPEGRTYHHPPSSRLGIVGDYRILCVYSACCSFTLLRAYCTISIAQLDDRHIQVCGVFARRIRANESLYVVQYRTIGRSTFSGSQVQYAGENITGKTITNDLQRIGKKV